MMKIMNNTAHDITENSARNAPYHFQGRFYEACDCFTICPCWSGNSPDEDECTGVFAWEIEKGYIDGIDVAGRRAVSVSYHLGHRKQASQQVIIFVDSKATPEQIDALVAALSGNLGGPLGELSYLLGELIGVEKAQINFKRQDRTTKLTVGQLIQVEGTSSSGSAGRAIMLSNGQLSTVLGSPTEVGVSGRFRVGLSEYGMDLDLRDRSTMSGRFSYLHTP
jgi:hypothetical protein